MCVSCVGDVDQDEKVAVYVLTKFVGKKDSLPYIYEECKVRKIKERRDKGRGRSGGGKGKEREEKGRMEE